MAAARDALGETVRAADPDRYLSTLYAPAAKRPALLALYAFNAEIAAIRERVREPLAGEVRLQWWRDALSARDAAGYPPAEALLAAMDRYDLPLAALDATLQARIFDLYDDPMPSRNDLEGYCGETASALMQLACLVLDPAAAAGTAQLSGHAGCALAIAGLLRLLPLHRARGQCYVPLDMLAAAGTTREALLAAAQEDGNRRAVAAMSALAREHLRRFEAEAASLPASLRPAFLPVALAGPWLDRIDSGRMDPLTEVADIFAIRRYWTLFRRAVAGW